MVWNFVIDLVADTQSMIPERHLHRIKREVTDVIETRGWNALERQSDRNLINNSPILQFQQLPLVYTNTLYRLYPKDSSQKKQYLTERLFCMILFNFLQQRMGRIDAAIHTLDAVADRLQSFDEIDLYVEFIFLPFIEGFQDRLMMYLLLSQVDPEEFSKIRQDANPLEHLPESLDLSTIEIRRHRYLSNPIHWCRVRHPQMRRMIIDIPTPIYPRISTDLVHLGLVREVGRVDKSLGEDNIRNSIDRLFPIMWRHPSLQRSEEITADEIGSQARFKCTQNGLSLMFDKMDPDLQEITLLQLQNTFLPLRNGDSPLDASNLVQHEHSIDAYQSSFRIKFHPSILPDSYPSIPSTTDRVGIYDLPLETHKLLHENLTLLAQHLPLLFDSPRLELDWISFDLVTTDLQDLWHYLYNHWGGDLEHIYITERYQQDVYVMIRGISDGALIRVVLRKEYCHTHFVNYSRTISAAEAMVKQHALDQIEEGFADYFEQHDLDSSHLAVLEQAIKQQSKFLEVIT